MVSHLHEGLKLGLEGQMQKWSELNQREAVYNKTGKIGKLPQYLLVNFVRFAWKKANIAAGTDAGRTKILRAVNYPASFDIYEFCTPEVQA